MNQYQKWGLLISTVGTALGGALTLIGNNEANSSKSREISQEEKSLEEKK